MRTVLLLSAVAVYAGNSGIRWAKGSSGGDSGSVLSEKTTPCSSLKFVTASSSQTTKNVCRSICGGPCPSFIPDVKRDLYHPVSHTTKSQKCTENAVETLCIIDEEALQPSESDVLSAWITGHHIREGHRRVVGHGLSSAGTAGDQDSSSDDQDDTASVRSAATARSSMSLSGVLAAEPAIVVPEGAWKEPELFFTKVGAVRPQMEVKLSTYLGKPLKAGSSDETVIQAYYYMQKQAAPNDIIEFVDSAKTGNAASDLVPTLLLVPLLCLLA
ncbi:hypothetical protein GNI_099260 [Gregarina niphandrodes]|uniref:Transmembrane protein n=1 Tax=Gregarina niphandrodes TaxID=110365 RepID=A0A023B4N1_GRENI|nr:hypothetical protein GNI_099260 [Gregarina niphandrodes]EZG57139.1 hypothetical protein GNI_099260 [Gregarina niphandrodes]|eukprot:XP_011131098.1 hypothetical protein GNI_099260 [Gregarina niphandrodes]